MKFTEFDLGTIRIENDADEFYANLHGTELYIYGAGGFGREVFANLRQRGISVKAFLDRNAEKLGVVCGCTVRTPESLSEKEREKTLVLFAIVMDKDERENLINDLHALGYWDIREAQFYRSLMVVPSDQLNGSMKEYYIQRLPRIERAWSLLADEKSRKIFSANIRAHFWRDYSECAPLEDNMYRQYFPLDVPLSKGYKCFVDCGSYIGDTIEALSLVYSDMLETVFAFEPNLHNFEKVTRTVTRLGIKGQCFPCAVDGNIGKKRFSAGYGSGAISEKGDEEILCVSLDSVLHGVEPTFIKMDIEGAEIDALKGAKRLISDSRPDLAICVYHNINHLWDILLMLEEMGLGYQFYLRSYNAYTMETVLYASSL